MRASEREAREDLELHGCAADGCKARVPMSSLACRHHWYALSERDRDQYMKASQRRNDSPEAHADWMELRRAAIDKMTVVGGLRHGSGVGNQGRRREARGARRR